MAAILHRSVLMSEGSSMYRHICSIIQYCSAEYICSFGFDYVHLLGHAEYFFFVFLRKLLTEIWISIGYLIICFEEG
jgi:hypothetical protein